MPATAPHGTGWCQNHLLAALPEPDRVRWLAHLEPVDMPFRQVLHDPGSRLTHVYFPTTAVVSLLNVMEDGGSTGIATVGCDGLVGTALFMGGQTTPGRALVHGGGQGYRLPAPLLLQAFHRPGAVMNLLLRYTQTLITQIAQTAVCNRHHRLDQQLCRWLLLNLDRLSGPDIVVTQEMIASLLGVRREGVTEAAGQLQADGLIRYRRGQITVLDRPGLLQRTCECYAVVRDEQLRLLPTPHKPLR